MLRDFIINISLLISCFVILGEVFKSRPLSPHLSWPLRVGWAVGYGIVGIILMQFSLHLKFGVIADLRHLAIVIPAVYGGMGAALVAAGIMAAARLVMFGVTPTSIYAAAGILLIGLVCGLLFRLRLGFALKAFLMNVFSLAAIIVLFYLHLEERELLCLVLSYHIPISLLGGAVAFYVTHFIRYSNEARRRVAENEGKFRQLTERYESVVNNVQEIIFQTDWKGRWTFLNPAWEHLTGYPVKESLGTPFTRYLHPDDLAGKEERYSAVTTEWKESLHLITRYETREKETRWMEIRAKVLKDENGLVTGTSGTMNDITVRKEAEDALQEANRKLQVLSSMDGLTNIANRRFFNERLEHECRMAGGSGPAPALIIFDIDCFKAYNDNYGHLAGDDCLKLVASTAEALLRDREAVVARYGGEEFAVILTGPDAGRALEWAERIRCGIEQLAIRHEHSQAAPWVTISAGVAASVGNPYPNELIDAADRALYRSKHAGRNRCSAAEAVVGRRQIDRPRKVPS